MKRGSPLSRILIIAVTFVAGSALALGQQIASISVKPNPMTSGGTSIGTISLNKAASGGGLLVSLECSSPIVTVPGSVTVAAGASSATFSISAGAVKTVTKATLKGTDPTGKSMEASLTINIPSVRLTELSVSPTDVAAPTPSTGTVTLSEAAPQGGFSVGLSTTSPSVTIPESVTVVEGSKKGTFAITTHPSKSAATATIAGLDANGFTATAKLVVNIPALRLTSISVSPNTVAASGTAVGVVTLSEAAPSSGFVVNLSSATSSASVPASVTVKSGSKTAKFSIATHPVTTSTPVEIIATDPAGFTAHSTLTVTEPKSRLASITFPASSATAGQSVTGTVILSAAAPTGGLNINLTSLQSFITVPPSVTVNAGSKQATFTVAIGTVIAPGAATITGVDANGYAAGAALSVLVPAVRVTGLSVGPSAVMFGNPSVGTVTLSGPAPTAGFPVKLSVNQAFAYVPASVTVASGATTATFTINSGLVAASSNSTVAAVDGLGYQATAVLTVNPQVSATLISMTDAHSYAPQSVTVPAGSVVVWTNNSANMVHTVTPDVPTTGMNSNTQYVAFIPSGLSFAWTVPASAKSGTAYYYHCIYHGNAGNGSSLGTGMAGVIFVK